ncbi:MAG TPA: OmpA family protein [Kineosporiaceae bacterium]|nr:OmpA family protein [Kineosporiaceae bacterium]
MTSRLLHRGTTLALTVCLGLGLAGCGDTPVSFGPAATSGEPASRSSADAASAAAADSAPAQVRFPEFPTLAVPDITSMTSTAAKASAAIAAAVTVPSGVQVTGARCDTAGRVVNRSGITTGGADDGSLVTGQGVRVRAGNGSGTVVDSGVTYSVLADGSGTVVTPTATLSVNADGSGTFVDGDVTYTVSADGSGTYVSGAQTVSVAADGSGTWVSNQGSVSNAGDGSGEWVGTAGPVSNNGDGTGTVGGVEVKMDPLPKMAPLGRFPKLQKLGPVGRPCGTLIRISAGLLFDFDKAVLRPEAAPVLTSVAAALSGASGTVAVNGHTDSVGTDAYNKNLSDRRAAAVVAALKADGFSGPQQPKGFGESQPVAPNTVKGKDNPAGRQLNRRVEIVIPG